ncbi:MAG: amidohydrolase [Anaerolineae bacterium]
MYTHALAPDLILHNGKITTQFKDRPECSAIAIKGSRVVALGDDEDILGLRDTHTRVVDLQGRRAIPGINDAHNHQLQVGQKMGYIGLEHCGSIAEMIELVRERAKVTPPGQWIIGEGWNESLFAEKRPPTRHDLDTATALHPVIVKRFFNMDVVNTPALQMAGLSKTTQDPHGGKIEREGDGTPNGQLRAAAKVFCRKLLPQPTEQDCADALEKAGEAYLKVGITSILDAGMRPYELRGYNLAQRQGKLKVRSNVMVSWHGFYEDEDGAELDQRAINFGGVSGLGDDWLRIGGLKMAIDGGTTSHTAWMFEPFEGETEVRDFNRLNPAQLRAHFSRGHELGWDIGIHAIGDRAHHEGVLAFADVLAKSSRREHRHSMIHAYFASEESLRAMREFDITAVIQPTFVYYEGDDLFRDVGAARAHRYKPMRTYLDRGIRVVATSDIPSTVHYDPFVSMYSIITRKTHKGTLIAPHEAVTRAEALYAYTHAGTWLTREEDRKGILAPGWLADVAVLDRDFFACDEDEIRKIKVVMTVIDGMVAFNALNTI